MSDVKKERSATVVVTDPVILSYVALNEPKAIKDGKPRYGASLIIPKSNKALVERISAAIGAAKEVGKAKIWGGKIPAKLELPLHDGDAERPDDPIYADSYFIGAYSPATKKPGVIDLMKQVVPESGIYSGMIARVAINFYPYPKDVATKGIACAFNNAQKVKDGDRLAGGVTAEEDFDDDFEFEDDDL